jgi:type I restriction enzyme S subunit
MLFPLPPLPEQTAIVRFLDYMDRRIRRFIRAKQKLIKLLEEYRQALIHHAVTGKIDVRTGKPYPAYKDSGVPWLGEVPEHWEVRRIKTLFRETDERNGDGSGPLLSLTRARGIVPQAEASNRIASVEDLSNYKVCKSGDLIMNRMQAWSGMFAVSGIDGVISPDYSVFKPKAPIDVHYFEALFKTPLLVEEFAKRSKGIGSGFNRLYTPDFGAVPIASPPLSEQTAIVEHLDAQTSKLDTAIPAARREIELLREYRERLIADMVTGKVDVREVAAQLPEELPEEEAELMDMDEIAEGDATDDDAAAEALPEEGVEA